MDMVGTVYVGFSDQHLDFMLYRTKLEEGLDRWVYWQRGISSHEIRNHLYQARIILDWDGCDYVYDFETGNYNHADDTPDLGWIDSSNCLDHSGGVIASFGTDPNRLSRSSPLQSRPMTVSAGPILGFDSDREIRLEIRSRPANSADWHNRSLRLQRKAVSNPSLGFRYEDGKVAFAA